MMRRFFSRGATFAGLQSMNQGACFATTAALYGKIVPFNLADIGEGILKVQVTEWSVSEGQEVEPFDPICEVESDKASTSIPSPYKGVIRKLYMEKGAEAFVGKPIVDIEVDELEGDAEDAPAAGSASPSTPAATATPSSSDAASSSLNSEQLLKGAKKLATPAVRRICMENNVALAQVAGSGKDGRVLKGDVIAFLENGRQNAVSNTTTSQTSSGFVASGIAPVADRVIELNSGVRKAMVKSMTLANAIPSFGASDEIEISKLMECRNALKPLAADRGVKLTFMPFFLKAASLALTQYPEINAHTNEDCTQLIVKGSHNIGFAFDTPKGLIVPNVKDCQSKSIFEIAAEMQSLMEKGKNGTLGVADMKDGTFALSNIGSIGATYTKPVINPPSVAIGAIGRAQKIPRFDANGAVYPANIINISWSADHRVVDGASMVRFSNLWKQYLENPNSMLLDTR